ncbi:MAG TPA: hypothetical protein VN924_12165 [Bryobacteraceae bacterium]|nr:hypothetical protein [Bryobacteraceae bacterium]
MEFKLFGPGGSPSDHFQKDLKVLLDLEEEAWDALASWLLTTTDFDSEHVSNPSTYGLQLPEIQRDLLLLNCPRERIERLESLLERLRPARERVYYDYVRFDH